MPDQLFVEFNVRLIYFFPHESSQWCGFVRRALRPRQLVALYSCQLEYWLRCLDFTSVCLSLSQSNRGFYATDCSWHGIGHFYCGSDGKEGSSG